MDERSRKTRGAGPTRTSRGRKHDRPELVKKFLTLQPGSTDTDSKLAREREAIFRLDLHRLGVSNRFIDVDLLNLPRWLPDRYRAFARELAGLLDNPRLIAISGPRGRGKTALGCGLVRLFKERGRYPRYITAADYLVRIAGRPWDLKERMRDDFGRLDLLVIDEVQMRGTADWQEQEFVGLIDRRYADVKATVLITNLEATLLEENVGESVHRRLIEEGGYVTADWPRIQELRPRDDGGDAQ